MATTPRPGQTKEIIGMRVKGIEDYRNDFDDHSYSDSSIAESFEHSMRLSQQGLIRNSFQVLLPIASPARSVKLPLTQSVPKDTFRLNSSEDEEDFLFTHDQIKDDRSSDTAATAEQLLIFEALIQDQIKEREKKEKKKEAGFPPKPKSLHKEQLSLLELDEDDSSLGSEGSSDGEESSSEDSDDSDDSDVSTSDKSSSWGSSEEDFDEGGTYTYFAAITAKPDANATIFTLTPFESVVNDATKSLKIKYDQIIYPTGSKFHSHDLLDTEDYHRLQNIAFVKWIKSNNELKTEAVETDTIKEEKKTEDTPQIQMAPDTVDIFVWLKKSINVVYTYYRGKTRNDLEFCYHLIDSSIFQHFEGDGYKIMLSIEERENYELFKLFELLLHTLGRLCSKVHHKKWIHKFYEYLELTKKMFPTFKVHLDLFKLTFKAHQDKKYANHCIQSFVEIYYRNQYAERRVNANEVASFDLCVKALVALDLYMENYSPLNHSILSDKAAYDINSESFKWLDAYNKYHNKYNHEHDDMDPDDNDGADEHKEQYHDSLQLSKLELCSNPQSRIDKLSAKYEQFTGFSLLRARCSWVIGHSILYHQRQFYESEKYFFEALYCLKTLQQTNEHEFFPLNGTMQTELASLVLIDYADVLLENKKYQYAINALECVLDCLQRRQKQERQFQIIRKLCMICTEKEDWNRAIKYHNITLKKLKDNYLNLNEFVYLSQQISTIHLKLNNFAQSECELQTGIKTIYENVLSQYHDINVTDIDNLTIHKIFEHCEGEERISIGSLLLMLANLYISGGNYLPQAIQILNYLKKYIFTNSTEARLLTIYFQLARAYFKSGRYEIADDMIQNEILVRYLSRNKDLLSSLEFVQLRILIMIHCKRFDDALKLLDDAMTNEIQKKSFVKRAKINYLKGRVLQSRCFNKLIESYNDTNTADGKEEEEEDHKDDEKGKDDTRSAAVNIASPTLVTASKTIYESSPKLTPKIPSNQRSGLHRRQHVGIGLINGMSLGTSDYAQDINPLDAISSLLLSHSDYKSIDPIMQAKCCLELSKTYLEIMMEYYALPHFVLMNTRNSEPILAWLGKKIFNDDKTPNNEVMIHCLDEIYHPLHTALTLSTTQTKDIGLLIESYIALAEFEFLKTCNNDGNNGDTQTSKNFWKQSKITLFTTYRDSDDWIFLRRIDRHSRLQIFNLFKRILRLLICFDNKFIADNVEIFVSYIALETFMIAQKDIILDADDEHLLKLMITRSHRIDLIDDGVDDAADGDDDAADDNNKNNVVQNPTVTLRICDEETERLSQIASAGFVPSNINNICPLVRRYQTFTSKNAKKSSKERDLDELFRMHWKMRTDANMFSGGRLTDIDNDKSLAQITKCIHELNVKLNRESTLDRSKESSSFAHAETFIISLDSIVFMFHPHTLQKYAIHKKRNEIATYDGELQAFTRKLNTIAFRDSDFLALSENPWIKMEIKTRANRKEREEQIAAKNDDINAHNERVRNRLKQMHAPWRHANRKKAHAKLSDEQQLLLHNELCLPYLKLESVSELLMCLDPQNILAIFGAIFSECPIVIVSKERCRCLAIIDALFVLMYPFSWQYPMISWLSPYCFELLNLPIPYIFGVANIESFDYKKYPVLAAEGKAVIIDADTNNVIKHSTVLHQLPLKLKSKLTRAMFRLMSGLLKNELAINNQENRNWVFPPRRRDNMQSMSSTKLIRHHHDKYNILRSPRTAPISICTERKTWYKNVENNNDAINTKMREMMINFQKEFCTAWVEVLEQYRLFWCHIDAALDKGLKEKSDKRIQKYAHPRYRKFLTKIQRTRMFSSFQCIRSLANNEMLKQPMFDNLVMRSLRFRQGLYHEIIQQQQQGYGRMKVSVEMNKKRHFINHHCTVRFDPKACSLYIIPDIVKIQCCGNQNAEKVSNLSPFKVELKATIYELEADDIHTQHPYIDRKQVNQFGDRYQFKIVHDHDGILTCNCQNYYQLTRWIHILRAHSMDTWSWSIKY